MSLDLLTLPKEESDANAIFDVVEEMRRQRDLWGEQNHGFDRYLVILMEEVGEAAQACLDLPEGHKASKPSNLYTELVQVAAVALSMVSAYNRGACR